MKKLKAVLGLFLFGLGIILLPTPEASASVSFSYPTPNYYKVFTAITPLTPSISGSGYTFSVSPALPTGLALDSSTGTISGTPSIISPARDYVITAASSSANLTFSLTLATLYEPSPFSYDDSNYFFTINRPIVPALLPSVSQLGVSYSASPALPQGVNLNQTTGVISGFPTEVKGMTSYIISSQNPLGLATTSISIAVPLPWARLGSNIANSGASAPSMKLDYVQNTHVPYVAYSNTDDDSLRVVKYSASSSSWTALGGRIASSTSQSRVAFNSNHNPYISHINNGSIFIRKYDGVGDAWNSLSSTYNSNNVETGSSLSNSATDHDLAINMSDDAYEAYIASSTLEIIKLVDNQAEFSSISNLEYPGVPSAFSYASSSLSFGTGSKIDPIIPIVSGKPHLFESTPALPLGLKLNTGNISGTGVIYGAPLLASERDYVIKARNTYGSATTSLRIKVDGPWKDLSSVLFEDVRLSSDSFLVQNSVGDLFFSSASLVFGSDMNVTGKYVINKYNVDTSSWEEILSLRDIVTDFETGTIDAEIVQAITTNGDDLYALINDDFVNYSDEENPQFRANSYLKKYSSTTNSWESLGEFAPVADMFFMPVANTKIAVSGDDVFIATYTEEGAISVYQFDTVAGEIVGFNPDSPDYSPPIADFSPSHADNWNQDSAALLANDEHVYLAYSDISNGGEIVVQVLDRATGEWDTPYTDSVITERLCADVAGLSLNSFKLDADGNPYVSFDYNGEYYSEEGTIDDCYSNLYQNINYSVIKKLDMTTGTFVDISVDDNSSSEKEIISFDNDGVLWSSGGSFSASGYNIRKYVSGEWVDNFPVAQFASSSINVYYPEIFFDQNDDIYAFSNFGESIFLAKYEGRETPLNYDYSEAPIITYPFSEVTYVTGRRIEAVFPQLTSSVSDISFTDINGASVSLPEGLYFQQGAIYGTPLIATSSDLRFKAVNEAGSSTFDIAINVVDPWVELGEPLSETAQAVSLAVDSNNKLWAAYSETVGEVNEIRARKYDNEAWSLMGGQISDSGISASHPKIIVQRVSARGVFVVYREDVSGKLWVKKYNSQSDSWEALGGAVTDYSSEYFDINPDYNNGVSVIYYDDVAGHSLVKTFHNDYWEITGGYLEDGQYPSLSSFGEKIYAVYSTGDGRMSVDSYEGFSSASTGKEVPLADIVNLVTSGDMSPQGGLSATSTPAVKFNQRLSLIPFAGASVVIPSGTVMTATENFDSSLLSASSTVDLTGIASSLNPKGTLQFGLPDLGLALSVPITINIPISGVAENTQLQVYSKTAGSSWTPLTTCYVVAGKCSFQTSHLSEFVAGTITSPSGGSSSGGGSTPVAQTCATVTYGDFAPACFGGYQYRGILSQYPASCSLTAAQIEASRRPCQLDGGGASSEGSLEGGEYPVASSSKPVEVATSSASTTPVAIVSSLWSEIRGKFIATEKALVKKVNKLLTRRLSGRILLQVEDRGQAWYVNPTDGLKYFLGRPEDAFALMRKLALGIDNKTFDSFKGKMPAKLSGRILLKVEDSGKAYYVNPLDRKAYYLGRPADAFELMRTLGLGVKNSDLRQIMIGD